MSHPDYPARQADLAHVRYCIKHLVKSAAAMGVMFRVDQVSQQPFASGNYATKVTAWAQKRSAILAELEDDDAPAAAGARYDPNKPDEAQGLYPKFEVYRSDGSSGPGRKHENCEYFVLDVNHDPYASEALRAYAAACMSTHPQLAAAILKRWGWGTSNADYCQHGQCLQNFPHAPGCEKERS